MSIPASIQPALDVFVARLQTIFGEGLIGVYLTGSLALGAYYVDKSDIDCTVLLTDAPDEAQQQALREMHRKLQRQYPKARLEVQYITPDELGKSPDQISPILSFHDKRLGRSYLDVNPVTWIVLREQGICLSGRSIKELGIDTTTTELLGYVHANVDSYWRPWLARASRFSRPLGWISLSDWAVEWSVAGLSRMLFTLMQEDIASKDDALRFMLDIAPEKHHDILEEALRVRTGQGGRRYASRFARRRDMLEYMGSVVGRFDSPDGPGYPDGAGLSEAPGGLDGP